MVPHCSSASNCSRSVLNSARLHGAMCRARRPLVTLMWCWARMYCMRRQVGEGCRPADLHRLTSFVGSI